MPPPRVYCDICEEFDLHETEDCPTQAMDDDLDEQQTHTHSHAKNAQPRPYCDNCEGMRVFVY